MKWTEHFSDNTVRISIKGGLSIEAWVFLFPIIQKILMNDICEVQLNLQEVETYDSEGWALLELLDSIVKERNGQLVLIDSQGQIPSYL